MIVCADAATRIDLAGGTLDIFPLYLFEDFGLTVNAAIDLNSNVRIATRKDHRIVLIAEDLDVMEQANSLAELRPGGALDLVARTVKFYSPTQGLEITTRNSAPAGSGLGASSSLLIALSAALTRLTGKEIGREKVIDYSANIETQSIRTLTGKQDYYPAMYGGFHALWFGASEPRREPLRLSQGFRTELYQRLILSFTGESRFSGTTNWRMLKRYVEQDPDTVKGMRQIRETAVHMRDALVGERLDELGNLLAVEWNNRKELAPGVTNARIDAIMSAARKAGAVSSKICGAGGGGCMISFVRRGRREAVQQALENAGAVILNYRFRKSGVRILEARLGVQGGRY